MMMRSMRIFAKAKENRRKSGPRQARVWYRQTLNFREQTLTNDQPRGCGS